MKICITPNSIRLLATYFKRSLPDILDDNVTYDEVLDTLYAMALAEFSGKEFNAIDAETLLQHMTIIPQVLQSYGSESNQELSDTLAAEVNTAKKNIYKASQSTNAEDFYNEVLKIANIVGVTPMAIVRLDEDERYDAVSWQFARTIAQESIWDSKTGYKENQKDPLKEFEIGIQAKILNSKNRAGYKFKLVKYAEVKDDESATDTTQYASDNHHVMVIVNAKGEIVKFDNELNEDENGKFPIFQLKSNRSEFDYQVNALSLSLSRKEDISMSEARDIIEANLAAHLSNVNRAIEKVNNNEAVVFEMDMALSGYGFIELQEQHQTPLNKLLKKSFAINLSFPGTRQVLASINVPSSNMTVEVKSMPLESLDAKSKEYIVELFTNEKLTNSEGKLISWSERTDLISTYVSLNARSSNRPILMISNAWSKGKKINKIGSVTFGNQKIEVKNKNAQEFKEDVRVAFESFISGTRSYSTSAKSEGRMVAESLSDVTFQGQFYKNDKGIVMWSAKPEISLGLYSGLKGINAERTIVESIVDNVISTTTETVETHIMNHGYMIAMPTKTDAGLILKGHGAYIGFNAMESAPDIDFSEEKGFWSRSIPENNAELETVTAEEEADALEWYKNNTLSSVLKSLRITSQVSEKGPQFLASFFKDSITLYAGSNLTDVYHESFHAYFNGILDEAGREEIYKELKGQKGKFTTVVNGESKTVKFSEGTNIELEEYLAEEFRAYARDRSKYNRNKKSKVAQFFADLLARLKSIFGNKTANEVLVLDKMNPIVRSAFNDLYEGNFDRSKFVAPAYQKEAQWHSLEANKKLKLSYQDVSIAMGSVQALLSGYINQALNSVSTPEANAMIMKKMAAMSTLDINHPEYKRMSDEIEDEIHSIVTAEGSGTNNGYGVFRLNESPVALKYALTFVKESLKQRLELYKQDGKSVIAKQNIKLLNKIIDNFGDVTARRESFVKDDTTILGLFFNNYNTISTEKINEAEVGIDESESLEEGLRQVYGKHGAEFSPYEIADLYTEQLLSSIIKYDSQGEGNVQLNRIGIPRLLPYRTAMGKALGVTKGLLDTKDIYNALVALGRTDKEISQLAIKLGDPSARQSRDEVNQWGAFWQSTVKPTQEVRIFTMEKIDNEEGVESHFIAKSGKFRQGSSILGREWKANFQDNIEKDLLYTDGGLLSAEKIGVVFGEMFRAEIEDEGIATLKEYGRLRGVKDYENLSEEGLILALIGKKFIPLEGSNDLYHEQKTAKGVSYRSRAIAPYLANPFPFLEALGITLPNTKEVRDTIIFGNKEKGIDHGIVSLIFNSLSNREDAVNEEDMLLDKLQEVFSSFTYRTTDVDTEVQPDLSGYLTILKDLAEEQSDDFVTQVGKSATGESMSERPYHSSLTIAATALNRAEHYDEILNTPGMEQYDYNYNPQIAASPWLAQMFQLNHGDPATRGKRNPDISITIDTLGGSKVRHGELEKGIGSLASDAKTKYNTDFHQTLIGRQELMRMEAKATSLTVFTPQYVRGDLRRGLLFNSEEIESIFSEGYLDIRGSKGLLLYNQFVGHLEAELVRITRLEKLKKDVEGGKKIEFDQAYLDRGIQLYMFKNIFTGKKHKHLVRKMLGKNISESFTLDDVLNREEKKEIESALKDYFVLRVNEESDNYGEDLIAAQNIIEEFAVAEESKEDTVKRMTQAFIVNNFIQNANFAAVFLGDMALYNITGEAYHKRIAGLISSGTMFRFDQTWYNYVNRPEYKLRGFANKHAQENNIKLESYSYNGYLDTGVMKEAVFTSLYKEHYDTFFNSEKPSETSKYVDMEEADAQAWITMDAYRLLADSNNDWSKDQEDIYQKLLAGEKVNPLKVKDTFPVKKYQYYGNVTNANASKNVKLQMTAFHKYSLMPLIPGIGLIEGTPLEDLNKKMMESGVDYITMQTGSKLSTIKKLNADPLLTEADNLYDSNREITKNSITTNRIHVRNLKNQVSVSSKYKGKITLWTQMRSMISLGLASDGIPMDYAGKKPWESLTPAQKLDASDNWKIIEEMNEVITLMESNLKAELVEDLGLDPKKTKEGKTTYEGDTSRLVNYIQDQMRSEDMLPEEIAYIVDENGQLIEDLSLSVLSEKIERILITMVDKKLRRLKVTGEGLTQVSGTMFEKKGSKPTEVDLKNYGNNGLATYYWENGSIRKMQVKIALQGSYIKLLKLPHTDKSSISVYSKGKLDFDASLVRLNESLKDESWMEEYGHMVTITGPRIPSQQENSLEAATVAEFLNPIAGPIIILPTDVVAKTGSDFDHDKLFMTFMNLVSYGRGKNISIEAQKYDRTIKESKKELGDVLRGAQVVLSKHQETRKHLHDQLGELYKEIKDVRKGIVAMTSQDDADMLSDLKAQWVMMNGHYNAATAKNDEGGIGLRFTDSEGIVYNYKDITDAERGAFIDSFAAAFEEIEDAQNSIRETYADRITALVKASKDIKASTKANLTKNAKRTEQVEKDIEAASVIEEKARRRFDSKSLKGLENELLQLFAKRITMGDNMAALVQNNSTDQVEPVSEELEKLVRGKYDKHNNGHDKSDKDISGTTIYDYRFNLKKHQENSVAMDSLGIAAVMSTFHAMFALMGAKLNGVSKAEQEAFQSALKFVEEFQGEISEEYKDAEVLIDKYSAYTLKFDHNSIEDKFGKRIALGVRNNSEGKTISSVIGQLINGYVDVAGGAWIFNAQGNKENTPILLFLVMAGVTPKTAIYFTSSSLVREYTRMKQEGDGVYSNLSLEHKVSPISEKSKVISSARAKMFAKYREMITKNTSQVLSSKEINVVSNKFNGVYDNATLRDFIKDSEPTWEEFVLFAHYLEIEDMSNDLTRFTANTKFSTQKMSSISDAEGRRIRTGYAKDNDNAIPNSWYDDMDSKTLNGVFNQDDFYVDIFSKYFKLRNHPRTVTMSVEAKTPVGVEKTVFQNDFKNDFINFLAQNSLYSANLYDGVTMIESDDVNAIIDYDSEANTYTYGAASLSEMKNRITTGLLNEGNANMDLLNKFPTDSHFIRYDIEYKRLQLEVENMTEDKIKKKFYYAFDSKSKIVTIEAVLTKIALYRSDNNIAMFDSRMGMSSIFEQIKKKYPHLESQFDLVYDLKRDSDESLGKTNLFIHDISDPDKLRIYKENYNELLNNPKQEVAEFFGKFKVYSLMQTGPNTRAKYSLIRIVEPDILEVIIKNGVDMGNVLSHLDEAQKQKEEGNDKVLTKYLDEFALIHEKMSEKSYKIRNKGYNYITDDFEGKKERKALPVKPLAEAYKDAMMTGKVVKVALRAEDRALISAGKKTTTIRSNSQINIIGLSKGESGMITVNGEKFVVTYRGLLTVDEAGGKASMIKSEVLSTEMTIETPHEVESEGVTYYAKYRQAVDFMNNVEGLGVYDIRKAPSQQSSNAKTDEASPEQQKEIINQQIKEKEAELTEVMEYTPEIVMAKIVDKITPTSAKKETGVKAGVNSDINISLLASKGKGGVSVEVAAENLITNGELENHLPSHNITESDARDMIIEMLTLGKVNYIKQFTRELDRDIMYLKNKLSSVSEGNQITQEDVDKLKPPC